MNNIELSNKYTKHNKIIKYGSYIEEYKGPGEIETTVIKSINTEAFYKLYLELNNVIGVRRMAGKIVDTTLSPSPLELLIHLMMKDDNFTIVFRNKDATFVQLGKELNKTPSSVYANIIKLRKAGYLVKDEDNLFVLSEELRNLIKLTRLYLNKGEPLKFDFLFKFCIEKK